METTFPNIIQMFTALVAIVNPISAIPLYLAFTENVQDERPTIARQTSMAIAIILVISVLVGTQVLRFFGITMDSFRIAGGLLLLVMAFNMLYARQGRARHTKEEDQEAIERDSVAIVPLAMPLLAGPGAISTAILFSTQVDTLGFFLLLLICVVVSLFVYVSLRLSPFISEYFSTTSLNIFTRIMGLFLAAIAVEFVMVGLKTSLSGYI